MIDVLVAGGGPAGLATAIHAAEAGFETVVVEPRRGPIDKACGEGLMPGAVADLARLGVALAPARPFRGIRYVDPARPAGERAAEARFRAGAVGLGVRRTVLHAALLERARRAGVRFVEARIGEVRQSDAWVSAGGGLRARWLVGADGLLSGVRAQLGVELPPRYPPRSGMRRHFRVAPWTDLVEVHLAPGCEAYVTPVASDCVGLAIAFEGRVRWPELVARFPALRERLCDPMSDVRGAGPFERRVARRVVGRVLLVGDAAGYLDPITAEGVRLALAQARVLVACLAARRPEAYEAACRRVSRGAWWGTAAILRARRSRLLAPRIVPVLRRFPRLFETLLAIVAGDVNHLPETELREGGVAAAAGLATI